MSNNTVGKVQGDIKEIFAAAVSAVYPPKMVRNAVTLSEDGKFCFLEFIILVHVEHSCYCLAS